MNELIMPRSLTPLTPILLISNLLLSDKIKVPLYAFLKVRARTTCLRLTNPHFNFYAENYQTVHICAQRSVILVNAHRLISA